MRIVTFPSGDAPNPVETWITELEAALSGESHGATADSWCELREDVRALAAPMTPEFVQRLEQELLLPPAAVPGRPSRRPTWLKPLGRSRPVAAVGGRSRPVAAIGGRSRLAAAVRGRSRLVAAMGAIGVLAAAVVIAVGSSSGVPRQPAAATPRQPRVGPSSLASNASKATAAPSKGTTSARASASANGGPATEGAAGVTVPQSSAPSAPGREQQLAASVSLDTSPANVQAISNGVARLAVRDEGFVQNSHVQVQQRGPSEATLTLSLPSARLGAALAAIGQLAPVRAESQSLQDITDIYDAARQRLTDATAERQALLRALARANTEGQIDSLRERLSQARSAIAQAQSAFRAVSQRASTAEVEVTVLGDARAESEGLTLHRGLHDASRVLTVALVVLLIAAAILVPLTLLIAALAGAGGMWRRYQRERALDSP
jgi:Domain of unknown function (DUF4349)